MNDENFQKGRKSASIQKNARENYLLGRRVLLYVSGALLYELVHIIMLFCDYPVKLSKKLTNVIRLL
jgi:hypothetical protein